MDMVGFLSRLNRETEVLLTLSIILFSGFILTRMTNTLNMPKVSGYILAGILIGPCCLNFIPAPMIEGMGFVSDLALAFIAFGVGKFFKKEVLMRTGKRIIVITLSEALAAGVLVTVVLKLVFRLNWEFALILGAIATATAPASTMMTINQYKAKGEFVDTLLQIVALDDVVCLLAFSIVSAIINGNEAGGFSAHDILIPVAYNLLVIVLGIFCGYFLSRLLIPARSKDNRLILAIAMLLGLSGICAAIDISPLLSCMVFGAVYINLTRDKKLFRQINSFTPPVMSIFFIVSGMNLDIGALQTVGAIGVGYFLVRIVGKYMGTYVSCLFMKTGREIRNYMGLALIPQAGVAIGLAFLGQRMLPPETGSMMLTIILSSSVLYEMVGPVSAKAALLLSGSISYGKKEDREPEGEDSAAGIEARQEAGETPSDSEEEELVPDGAKGTGGEAWEETGAESEEEAWEESGAEPSERALEEAEETWKEAEAESWEGALKEAEAESSESALKDAEAEEAWEESKAETEEKAWEESEAEAVQLALDKDEAALESKPLEKAGLYRVAEPAESLQDKRDASEPLNHSMRDTKEREAVLERAHMDEAMACMAVISKNADWAVGGKEENSSAEVTEAEAKSGGMEKAGSDRGAESGVVPQPLTERKEPQPEAEKAFRETDPEKASQKPEIDKSSQNRKKEESRKKTKNRKGAKSQEKADKDISKKAEKRKDDPKVKPETASGNTDRKKKTGHGKDPEKSKTGFGADPEEMTDSNAATDPKATMDWEAMADPKAMADPETIEDLEAIEDEDELHAVLPELREYSKGVEEGDVYDIEKEWKPPKSGKKKKGKKASS